MGWGDVMRGLAGALQGYNEGMDYQQKWDAAMREQAQRAKQFQENMDMQRADLDERKRARIASDRTQRMDALSKLFERQGIYVSPDKMQQYVTGESSAPLGQTGMGGTMGNMADLASNIADTASQVGRSYGPQFTTAGKTALDASTAGKGQRIDLANGLGYAQDTNALEQANEIAKEGRHIASEKDIARFKAALDANSAGDWKLSDKLTGPNGRPLWVNEKTRQTMEADDGIAKAAKGNGNSTNGMAQNMTARLLGAVSEGRLGGERMTKFEDAHLKNGKLDFGPFDQTAAEFGAMPAKGPLDIAFQAGGEAYSNIFNPELMQYFRDARLIARAEQLMSARGGSEAQATDNAKLARGGAYAPKATVLAARKSRNALFGKLGAVVQTLTPDQLQKLNVGLQALQNDDKDFDYAALGKEVFGERGIDGMLKAGQPAQPVNVNDIYRKYNLMPRTP